MLLESIESYECMCTRDVSELYNGYVLTSLATNNNALSNYNTLIKQSLRVPHDIVYSQIYEWCNYMKMSGRLPEVKSENSGSRKLGSLHADHLALLDKSYVPVIKEYADLTSQYSKEEKRASVKRTKSLFPDKHRWHPEGRLLSASERQLLVGPR